MKIESDEVYYWLSQANISINKQNTLVQMAGGAVQLWYDFGAHLQEFLGDKWTVLKRFRDSQYIVDKLNAMQERGIEILSICHAKYPKALCNIHNAPNLLYAKGDLNLLGTHCVAVVGTRHCSRYGQIMTKRISQDLVDCGITVVSGLATGIDTYAHVSTLEAKGKTIAVLGGGFEHIAPISNTNLAKQISSFGLLLSEYAPSIVPAPYMFVARNRIVSGISKGIVVVEAGQKSGSRITADLGLEQGKTVYSVPGNANSPQSIGTNALIKLGATLITDGIEVAKDLGIVVDKQKPIANHTLDFFEQQVYDIVSKQNTSFDEMVIALSANPRELAAMLTSLEIRGIVTKHPGNLYGT